MKRAKKYYILVFALFLIIVSYGVSYAFLNDVKEEHGKLNIVAGTLNYKIESSDLDSDSILISANTSKEIKIKLTSLNEVSSKYELYYVLDKANDNVIVGYSESTKDGVLGTIDANKSKIITIVIKNDSNTDSKVSFKVIGGLLNNELVLKDGNSLNQEINLCHYETGYVWNFDYTGKEQEFVTPCSGSYKIELWGASGEGNRDNGISVADPGLGAYTSGNIVINRNKSLYIYVGSTKSYNAGMAVSEAPGGGATDVRITNGEWYLFSSLKDRIMVAAGGGGGFLSENTSNRSSGHGGGLIGYDANAYYTLISNTLDDYRGHGGTQKSVGKSGNIDLIPELYKNLNYHIVEGGFGLASYSIDNINVSYSSSGGGGYYGGGHGIHPGSTWSGGGGGSSFISGHNGCDAIKGESTENNIIHTGQSIHYSGMYFTNTVIIDGSGYNWTTEKEKYVGMPTHDGTSTITGNSGNGYAKITYLGK